MTTHLTGTRDEWLAARLESARGREGADAPSDERGAGGGRRCPGSRVDKDVSVRHRAGPASLADLFQGRSQLLVYHFMFGPDYQAGCPSCSAIADGFNGSVVHLANHDVTLMAVSRAPLAKLQAYKQRMGWTFPWASSHERRLQLRLQRLVHRGAAARRRHRIQLPARAARSIDRRPTCHRAGRRFAADGRHRCGRATRASGPGLSAFVLEDGVVYHTYSTYSRGVDGHLGHVSVARSRAARAATNRACGGGATTSIRAEGVMTASRALPSSGSSASRRCCSSRSAARRPSPGARSMSAMGGMPMPGGWTMSMTWMRMPGQTWPGAAASFLGMWIVMMVAMMLPALVPMLRRYREAVDQTGRARLDAPDGAGCRRLLRRLDRDRAGDLPARRRAGGDRDASGRRGPRRPDRGRRRRPDRGAAPVHPVEGAATGVLWPGAGARRAPPGRRHHRLATRRPPRTSLQRLLRESHGRPAGRRDHGPRRDDPHSGGHHGRTCSCRPAHALARAVGVIVAAAGVWLIARAVAVAS